MSLTPIFLGLQPLVAHASGSAPFNVKAAVATRPPRLDGTLRDPQWKSAAHVTLAWDWAFRRPAEERTDVYLLVDAQNVYLAFVARQREPLVATQHTNDQPLDADDTVRVYFWPAGPGGNEYEFVANPLGTRYAFSTENTAFSPVWQAVAKETPDGYTVTERIPLGVMRGDGRSVWRLQFDRRIRRANEIDEWAYNSAQGSTDTNLYAGVLDGMQIAARNARTKPRLSLYTLGRAGTLQSGGSASRAGADLSLPMTQTSSFIATFHPDYSNVELDQQTIAPTAFPRQFKEVRPFFTQGSQFYNTFNCNDCLNWPLLYTPSIPTPKEGYALEAKQGQFTFGSFDAVGEDRDDNAQALLWRSDDRHYEAIFQRVGVDLPGIRDVAVYFQPVIGNYHNFSAYATLGNESGTLVPQTGEGAYREYGVNLFTPKEGIYAAYHDVGAQYAPPDAFNQISDVHGPTVYVTKELDNSPKDFLQSVIVSQDVGLMHDHAGVLSFAYDSTYVTFQTRNTWFLGITTGDQYVRFPGKPGGFTDQNGVQLTYGNNTSTPSWIAYDAGRFGAGFLRSTDLEAAIKVKRLGTLTAEAYETADAMDDGDRYIQWLERIGLGYQIGPGQSLALGWRRIIGTAPPFFSTASYLDATNLSMAYYRRWNGYELYLALGDPNQISTRHDVILKLIRYIGADKGT